MKKQIVVIGGGNISNSYEEYLQGLRGVMVDLDRMRAERSKASLSKNLGNDFDVLVPPMPNNKNAKYNEWEIWFSKIAELLDDRVVLVGHSLGGIFLAKYLSENDFPKNIIATFLIAAPYDEFTGGTLEDFNFTTNLKRFNEQGGNIFLYFSKDDYCVPFSELEKYKTELPNAKEVVFSDKQHFNQEEFPKLAQALQGVFSL